VILVIRFIGIMNAAIWLGAAVSFTFAVGPAFFTGAVEKLGLHPFWHGAMAQLVIGRYFALQYVCGVIALAHLLAEWVYLGRPLQKLTLGLIVGLLGLGFAGGLWLQPKLKKLHLIKYSMSEQYKPIAIPAGERIEAARSFGVWHGVARALDLLALGGLVIYFWRVNHPTDNLRFVTSTKFRS